MMDEMSSLSVVVASHGAQLSILNDQMIVTRCQMYEDNCGRINQENLNRFLLMWAPSYPLTDQMQDLLKKQVNKFSIRFYQFGSLFETGRV